jgi:hypothetical protein
LNVLFYSLIQLIPVLVFIMKHFLAICDRVLYIGKVIVSFKM